MWSSLIMAWTVASPSPSSGTEVDVERAFKAFIKAERADDVAAIERLTDSRFVQHHASGVAEPLEVLLATRRNGSKPMGDRAYLERDVQTRVIGGIAIRNSVVRIKGAKPGVDLWVRSTVVLERSTGAWRVAEEESALLAERPAMDEPPDSAIPSGDFEVLGLGRFTIFVRDSQPLLRYPEGREVPLIPLGIDIFSCGWGSTLSVQRDAGGRAVSMIRKFGDRVAWTGRRLSVSGTTR